MFSEHMSMREIESVKFVTKDNVLVFIDVMKDKEGVIYVNKYLWYKGFSENIEYIMVSPIEKMIKFGSRIKMIVGTIFNATDGEINDVLNCITAIDNKNALNVFEYCFDKIRVMAITRKREVGLVEYDL